MSKKDSLEAQMNRESLAELRSVDLKAWREKCIREAHQRFLEEKKRKAA